MKKYLIILGLCIVLFSCGLFKPSGFKYKYTGKYTGLDTLIFIDGYYKSVERQSIYDDKYHSALMFYRDGIVCFSSTTNLLKSFRDGIYPPGWGTYRIYGDTIRSQIIPIESTQNGAPISKSMYIILSDTTIAEIDREGKKVLHTFYPLEERIDSTNWLLKKKWFWEKEAYKKHKKNK